MHQGTHRVREVAQKVQRQFTKTISLSSLRRLLRQHKLRYKRIRRSCRHLRDETAYRFFKEEMQALVAWAETGEVDLCFCDEMGLNREAVVPYGWQPQGQSPAYVAATPSGNLTTLGFFYRDNRLVSYVLKGAMSAELLVACVDEFVAGLSKPTVLVIDNASTHTSKLFRGRLAEWRSKGLLVQYIPAYCPELNLIECLWKQIKYHWLAIDAYLTQESLRDALESILSQIGTKYRITFA